MAFAPRRRIRDWQIRADDYGIGPRLAEPPTECCFKLFELWRLVRFVAFIQLEHSVVPVKEPVSCYTKAQEAGVRDDQDELLLVLSYILNTRPSALQDSFFRKSILGSSRGCLVRVYGVYGGKINLGKLCLEVVDAATRIAWFRRTLWLRLAMWPPRLLTLDETILNSVIGTLPSGISLDAHTLFDQPVQRQEGGLYCPSHWADDDESIRLIAETLQ